MSSLYHFIIATLMKKLVICVTVYELLNTVMNDSKRQWTRMETKNRQEVTIDCEELTANEGREMGACNFHYVDHKYGVQGQMTSTSKRDLPFSFIDYDISQLERIYCSSVKLLLLLLFPPFPFFFFLSYIIFLLIFKISKRITWVSYKVSYLTVTFLDKNFFLYKVFCYNII